MPTITQIPITPGETGIVNPISISKPGNKSPVKRDSSDRSAINVLSKLAQRTGLDITRSSRYTKETGLAFSFAYQDTFIQNIRADGFWSAESQSLSFDLSFEMNESLLTGNTEKNRTIRFDLHISVQNLSVKELETGKITEPIQDFVSRIAKYIAEYAADKDHEIAALVLDFEDARDIYEIDDGRTLKMIYAAIALIYMTNQILDRDEEDVILKMERKEEPYILFKKHDESNIQFSVKTEIIEANQNRQEQETSEITSEIDLTEEIQDTPESRKTEQIFSEKTE